MRFYGRTQPLKGFSIYECLRMLQQAGFDGVELCLENDDVRPEVLDASLARRVGETVRELGLTPFSVSYHQDYIYNGQLFDLTRKVIPLVRAFGTDVLVISGTRARTGDRAEWERMVARTRELVQVAEEQGVTLAEEFEPHFIVGSTEHLLRLFDEIPSPALAANLDLGHVFLCDPDPVEAIHALGSKIVHGHVENMAAGVHRHLLPHEGDMDLRVYLRALEQVGFQGGLALDLYDVDYAAVAPAALAYLRGLVNEEGGA